MVKFEITIYNKEVREKVEAGERHQRFRDTWADFQYIEIDAADEKQAPPSGGFLFPGCR